MIALYNQYITERLITGLAGEPLDFFRNAGRFGMAVIGSAQTGYTAAIKILEDLRKYINENDFTGSANDTGFLSLRQKGWSWRGFLFFNDKEFNQLKKDIKDHTLESKYAKFDLSGREIPGLKDAKKKADLNKIVDMYELRVREIYKLLKSNEYDLTGNIGPVANIMSWSAYGAYDLDQSIRRVMRYGKSEL